MPPQRNVAGPFVETTLPARAVRALGRDERVTFVGPAGGERVEDWPTISQSLPATQSHWAQAYFSKGTGTRVAVLETGQATTPQSCFRVIDRQTISGAPNSHMTKSLGILGNRYGGGSCAGP